MNLVWIWSNYWKNLLLFDENNFLKRTDLVSPFLFVAFESQTENTFVWRWFLWRNNDHGSDWFQIVLNLSQWQLLKKIICMRNRGTSAFLEFHFILYWSFIKFSTSESTMIRVLRERVGMLRGCWGSKYTLGMVHNLQGQGHLVSSAVPPLKSVSHLPPYRGGIEKEE